MQRPNVQSRNANNMVFLLEFCLDMSESESKRAKAFAYGYLRVRMQEWAKVYGWMFVD